MEFPGAAGFGNDRPDFWIGHGKKLRPAHVAFAAADRAIVDAFYDAAIAAGGRDNGKGWYPDRGEQIPQVHIPDLRGYAARCTVRGWRVRAMVIARYTDSQGRALHQRELCERHAT